MGAEKKRESTPQMPFTPVEGTIGGCVRPIFFPQKNSFNVFDVLYLGGLVTGGILTRFLAPQNLPLLSQAATPMTAFWYGLAGLLVGLGSQMGSGCTSGHMICGLARLSKRSFVAVLTFCSVAFLNVKLLKTATWFNSTDALVKQPFVVLPSVGYSLLLVGIFGVIMAAYRGLYAVRSDDGTKYERISTYFNAVVFAMGLGLSGMTNPTKVLGFFDVGGPNFDPTLVCVAMGATMLDMLLFNAYILKQQRPKFAHKFSLPVLTDITPSLVVGSAIFGCGWGLMGICPGPAVVNLPTMAPQIMSFLVTFAIGVFLREKVRDFL